MILPIAYYNDPVLRKKGEPVRNFDPSLRKLHDDMVETMKDAEGIGLAAQQIGRALQFCVVDLRESPSPFQCRLDGRNDVPPDLLMPLALANPEVAIPPGELTVFEEGCLSFPDIRGNVERPDRIHVHYQDLHGIAHDLECDGILARCILHEVDHLNGVLFIDRMEKKTLKEIEKKLKRLKRQTRDLRAAAKK